MCGTSLTSTRVAGSRMTRGLCGERYSCWSNLAKDEQDQQNSKHKAESAAPVVASTVKRAAADSAEPAQQCDRRNAIVGRSAFSVQIRPSFWGSELRGRIETRWPRRDISGPFLLWEKN